MRSLLTIQAVWVMALAVSVSGGRCLAEKSNPEAIPVHAWFKPHPALDSTIRNRIRNHANALLRTITGRPTAWITATESLGELLPGLGDATLTPDACRAHQLDKSPQALILAIRYRRGTYSLNCASFNRDFDDVIFAEPRQVLQRQLVTVNLSRMIRWTWRPVGKLVRTRDGAFQISFRPSGTGGGTTMPQDLPEGTPLEIVRFYDGLQGLKRHRWNANSLRVTGVGNGLTLASVAVPPYRPTDFFDHLANSRAYYRARVIRLKKGLTTIHVLVKSTRQPRECCEIHLSRDMPDPSRPPQGQPTGLTDDAGNFTISADQVDMRYATIVLGNHRTTRAIDQSHLLVEIPFQPMRGEIIRAHNRIRQYVSDAEEQLQIYVEQLTKQLDIEETFDEVDKIVGKMQRMPSYAILATELRKILKKSRREEFVDLVKQIEGTILLVDRSKSKWLTTRTDGSTTNRQRRIKKLIALADRQLKQQQWQVALDTLDQLLPLNPENKRARFLQRQLRQGIPTRSASHATARKTARQLTSITTVTTLLDRWKDIVSSLKMLIEYNDGLTLIELRTSLENAQQLAVDERERISKTLEGTTTVSADEKEALSKRAAALAKVLPELVSVNGRAQDKAVAYLESPL